MVKERKEEKADTTTDTLMKMMLMLMTQMMKVIVGMEIMVNKGKKVNPLFVGILS